MVGFNLQHALDVLANQQLLLGFFLLSAGLVFMIFGVRVSRPLVAVSFGVLGFVLCFFLPIAEDLKLGLAFMGAIGLGAASTCFIRAALTILAGAWAACATLLVVVALADLPMEAVLMIGTIAFVCAASLALIMYQEVTAFVLSLEGSLLFIAGLVILANQNQILWKHIRDMLIDNPVFAPFALLAGAMTGFYWQSAELRQRDAGTSA
jgi:hypothetical protein